jgi:DNA polymerase II small subunit
MISDVHVGSNTFLPDAWNRFINWISTSDVNYLLIAGDVVDGIGIYPGQDKELVLKDIHLQYAELARMLSKIPNHIRIIISLGNHDAVRGAEPQPALPDKFREEFSNNVIFVENPAWVELSGVTVLMYHGKSFDDMIKSLPGASYSNICPVMEAVLKRRHLAISYGEKTPILACKVDPMVIDPIPDVLLTGHVHILGIMTYRDILCVNSGCWQSQTEYQKQFGTVPTPGIAVILDLQTFKYETKDFTRKR